MDFLATIAMSTMVQRWCRPAGENNAPTQNSLDTMDAHDLWSLLLRWGAAGRRKLVSFESQLAKAKACLCWLVPARVRSHCRCRTADQLLELMG